MGREGRGEGRREGERYRERDPLDLRWGERTWGCHHSSLSRLNYLVDKEDPSKVHAELLEETM